MLKIATRDKKFRSVFSIYLSSHKFNKAPIISSLASVKNGINPFSTNTNVAAATDSVNNEIPKPPAAPKVVICGGGLIGTSVAYHLAELGYKDVVLLTRDKLGSGTTFYSTGVISVTRTSKCETLLSKYSVNLYQNLQKKGHLISICNFFYGVQKFYKQTCFLECS